MPELFLLLPLLIEHLNGNLLTVADSLMSTWNYSYVNLNRLTGATSSTGYYASWNARFL
jgi:hypothetical protein